MKKIQVNGYDVTLHRISNYLLYQKIINNERFKNLEEPEIPKFWSEQKQAWLENPMSPEYTRDIQLYDIERNQIILDIILSECITIDINQVDKGVINKLTRTRLSDNIELAVLKYVIFKNIQDINKLIENLLLTEHLVYNYITLVSVTRSGISILEHNLKDPINSQIEITPITVASHELVNPLHEYNSCVETGLDWDRWLNNDYDLEMMAYTIAMYRLNKLIEVHQQDEQSSKGKK